ncbi:hypothetical protein [Pseudalkalibacillus sp. NRS-1564]|uniref:hypothetical protein n=1 Tax=Pseudalkalibacillus sp. NRS-1564 TaxID=3233900 RepID=UPI003D2DA01E
MVATHGVRCTNGVEWIGSFMQYFIQDRTVLRWWLTAGKRGRLTMYKIVHIR